MPIFPSKVYIGYGPVPGPLPADPPAGSRNVTPLTHKFELRAQMPLLFPGGEFRLASQKEFPISSTLTGATLLLHPGAVRELHWHPNAAEWQYYISGRARMTVFAAHGRAQTYEFGAGDVGYVPQGFGHYIENIGSEDCQALLVLKSGTYEEISLSAWLAANPRQLLSTNFGVPEEVFSQFPSTEALIAGGKKA